MKILNLTLKKKWFDMILSGEKTEEYREIKSYWISRLMTGNDFKDIEYIRFTNGYSKDAPTFLIYCKHIEMAEGRPEWGAEPNTKYFVLKLGCII